MKLISVFLADGFEEVEGLTVVDLFRRAGMAVEMVSVTGDLVVHGAHKIDIKADVLFDDMNMDTEMLVLPGGIPGVNHLQEHQGLTKLLKQFYDEKRYIAAICAAPSILGGLGFLYGCKACSHPSKEDALTGAEVVREPVVIQDKIIMSRGMGTAIPFALTLVSILCGSEKADEVKKAIVYE